MHIKKFLCLISQNSILNQYYLVHYITRGKYAINGNYYLSSSYLRLFFDEKNNMDAICFIYNTILKKLTILLKIDVCYNVFYIYKY